MRELDMLGSTEIIRPARFSDVPKIRQIVDNVLVEFSFEADPNGIDQDLQDPIASYNQANGLLDVLVRNDHVIGFVGLIPLNTDTIELRKLYLAQNVRRCGFGGLLLDHAINWARQQHFQWMTLQTSSKLTNAAALYKRRGFRYTTGQSRGKDCDQLMRLALAH